MGFGRRLAALLTGATLVGGSALLAAPGMAAAASMHGHGHTIHPAQATQDNPDSYEWVGSYTVNAKQAWCVDYMYKAPDSDEKYEPGDTLETKWGTPLPVNEASQISYLLLRYGNTTNDDEATALAYWLQAWTAPATDGHPTTGVPKKQLAYDADFHKQHLPDSARQAIDALLADAEANHGPWTAKLTAPRNGQTIGTAGTWQVQVRNAAGKGLPDVPVTLTASGATLAEPDGHGNSATSGSAASGTTEAAAQPAAAERETTPTEDGKGVTLTTGEDGTAEVAVTPAGKAPKVTASFASPNETPKVQQPLAAGVQKIVLTGGEKQVTASTVGAAAPKPTPTQTVPVKIPAGGSAPNAQASAAVTSQPRPGLLLGVGALLLAAAGGASLLVARRLGHKR